VTVAEVDEEATEPQAAPDQIEIPRAHGAAIVGDDSTVLFPTVDEYVATIESLLADGYETCIDLTAVDYLTHPGRSLPAGIETKRFEVVVSLLNHTRRERARVRVQLDVDAAALPTLFDIFPGTESMEREVFDMFGVTFDGHPDMTRILMPENWHGHPLRKDYDVGSIPVQFKAGGR
jgi:NADH-quinone oxidoreductase subunit C